MKTTQWKLSLVGGAMLLSFHLWVELQQNVTATLMLAANSYSLDDANDYSISMRQSTNGTSTNTSITNTRVATMSMSNVVSTRDDDSSQPKYNSSNDNSDNSKNNTRVVMILVEVSGELGNHLNHLAHGKILQHMLLSEKGISSKLVVQRSSNDGKYFKTQRELRSCFRNWHDLQIHDKRKGKYHQFTTTEALQANPNSDSKNSNSKNSNSNSNWSLEKSLANALVLDGGTTYERTLQAVDAVEQILQNEMLASTIMPPSHSTTTSSSSPPSYWPVIIYTKSMINREFMNLYYDELRDWFALDEEVCCSSRPITPGSGDSGGSAIVDDDDPTRSYYVDDDETVFHFRNFVGELSKKGKSTGLEELSPHKTATELFEKTNNATTNTTTIRKKIAIATRFGNSQSTQGYLQALEQAGYETRWLKSKLLSLNSRSSTNNKSNASIATPPSAALQDFCAMTQAMEVVGMVRSTFLVWAALLGRGTARLYSVDSKYTRRKSLAKNQPVFRTYNWTHPELKRRIHFELYHVE